MPLPDNVAIYIAGKIKSNIRELEGSLIRLIAYASLTGQEISLPLAQEVLKNILEHDEKAVTIEIIQKFVADYYHLKLVDLKSRNNSKSVAMPRQIAMYLCKSLTHASLPEIGRSFGGKHHSTVIHSIRKIEDLRKKDGDFNTLINNFLERFVRNGLRTVFHRPPTELPADGLCDAAAGRIMHRSRAGNPARSSTIFPQGKLLEIQGLIGRFMLFNSTSFLL